MVTGLGMRPRALTIQPGDRVAVTGSAGFIGSAIARALVARGAHVVAIVQPGATRRALEGIDVEIVEAELGDAFALVEALDRARVVFHVSPDYRGRTSDARSFRALNVEDTRCVLSAARALQCEKIIYTSSVGTLGLEGTSMQNPADESSVPRINDLVSLYKESKYVTEHEVLREAAEGLPITLVLPTTSIGHHDYAPTPSGRIILDYLNGQSANWFDTALNVVDVDDLAEGYLLAAERGANGRSYILGGENLRYQALFELLAACVGVRTRGFRVPRRAALTAAFLSELFEGRLLGREPSIPLEGVRLAATPLIFSDERARRELGYASRPAAEAIERAARWFTDNGYVSKKRISQIVWHDAPTRALM